MARYVAAIVPKMRALSHEWDMAAERCWPRFPAAASRRTVSAVRQTISYGVSLHRTEGSSKAASVRASAAWTPKGAPRYAFYPCGGSDTCGSSAWKAVLARVGVHRAGNRVSRRIEGVHTDGRGGRVHYRLGLSGYKVNF